MPKSTRDADSAPLIPVSPLHSVDLAPALRQMVDSAPDRDYVMRGLSRKTVNDQPLILGELVIAGADTREEYPLAREFPVHFRKTYYPICFHQDPAREFENLTAVSEAIDVPPPIGCTRTSFRSCFIPGTPYSVLSPFGVEPDEANIRISTEADTAALIGLWHLLESIHAQVTSIHANGIVHGDLFLHNVIVSTHPLGAHLIDFEQARLRERDKLEETAWIEAQSADLRELLREAIYIQCGLGRQVGALAEQSLAALPTLFTSPDRFERAMDEASYRAH